MDLLNHIISKRWRPGRAALAGFLASIVYTIVMEGDMALTGNRFNDVQFILGLLNQKTASPKHFSWLAWIIHLLNGVALGELYASVFRRFLPGSDWLKGVIFSEGFVVATWSSARFVDAYHPLIKSGELPKLVSWITFFQNIVRHFAFGLTLGWIYCD